MKSDPEAFLHGQFNWVLKLREDPALTWASFTSAEAAALNAAMNELLYSRFHDKVLRTVFNQERDSLYAGFNS
jgi:hypothetical protein